jgi:hypothetical protein
MSIIACPGDESARGQAPRAPGHNTSNSQEDLMACSHVPTCPLFKHFESNGTLPSWKVMFCDSDTRSKSCERFKLAESGQKVPSDMLPNGKRVEL